MKRLVSPVVIGALVFAVLVLLDGRHQMGREISAWRAENTSLRKANAEAEAASRAAIADLEAANATLAGEADSLATVIASKDGTIAALRGKVAATKAETALLRTEIQPVLDANPKVSELVTSLDATIALQSALIMEQQELVTTLKRRVELGDERLANQVAIGDEWRAMYERERALRVNCEQGLGLYQKQARQSRLWKVVGKVGPPVAFVVGFIAGK